MTKAIPQHSSKSVEHFTPVDIVERARGLLGGFDLDPASCEEANKVVGAATYFGKRQDGLRKAWQGRVFLNPPGGKVKRVGGRWARVKAGPGESSMRVWWDRLAGCWMRGEIESAFFVGFTLEILRTSQYCVLPVHAFPRCYPRERLPFRGDQPTHANVLVYLPPKELSGQEATDRMHEAFGLVGFCEGAAKVTTVAAPLPTGYQRDPRQGALL